MDHFFWICVAIASVAGFLLMGIDKTLARKKLRRVPEKVLFGVACLLGSLGVWAGMYTFRHKTKHMSFVIGIPFILAIQIVLVILYNHYIG